MARMRLSLVLPLVGVYLLFWLGLRHDELPSHNTARRQRHDPNSNYGGSHGAGGHDRPHRDRLNPPDAESPVLAAAAVDAAAGSSAPRVRRWADEVYPPPPPRVVEQADEAGMGVDHVVDDVVGVDDVGALDASGMEEGSVEAKAEAEGAEAEEEEGVLEAEELPEPQPIDVVQEVRSDSPGGRPMETSQAGSPDTEVPTHIRRLSFGVTERVSRPQLELAVATEPLFPPAVGRITDLRRPSSGGGGEGDAGGDGRGGRRGGGRGAGGMGRGGG